jgi:hypothetical protein
VEKKFSSEIQNLVLNYIPAHFNFNFGKCTGKAEHSKISVFFSLIYKTKNKNKQAALV